MQKHTKRQVKDAFISDVCHRCLCVISDQTEIAKEKEYLRPGSECCAFKSETKKKCFYQTN